MIMYNHNEFYDISIKETVFIIILSRVARVVPAVSSSCNDGIHRSISIAKMQKKSSQFALLMTSSAV